MIEPRRAPVEPRVFCSGSGCALRLIDEARALLDKSVCGAVAILGPPGSGKTVALEHLAAFLPASANVIYLDEASATDIQPFLLDHLVFYTPRPGSPSEPSLISFRLAPWTRDELVVYLAAAHRERCSSVLDRLPKSDPLPFAGLAAIWRIILDRMAEDDGIPDAEAALARYVEDVFRNEQLAQHARNACLGFLALAGRNQSGPENAFFPKNLNHLLQCPDVQVLLATDQIIRDLVRESVCEFLRWNLPANLIRSVGARLAGDERRLQRLSDLFRGPAKTHAMTASLLAAADKTWVPRRGSIRQLKGALITRVCWPGVHLASLDLEEADFTQADLHGAVLDRAHAPSSKFQFSDLRGASLFTVDATGADFAHAKMASVQAEDGKFALGNLEEADLSGAFLKGSSFHRANLVGVTFRGADLTGANLISAKLGEADFSEANLTGAFLEGVRLRGDCCTGACLRKANLKKCDLEEVNLDGAVLRDADLEGALLTGSSANGADFSGAILRETGLAEVNWEGAELRNADLRGATFHMGTTRSGLVGSPIASEGSRTGFYTDDYEDRYFKAPEEIRKANLRGADLRGARLENVDFYLVDVRDALYGPEQEEHLRRCGAILEARV
jgi:uncharacterized protein YjbI with pentapeptide repeats/energy-coupling factor transporter ATP-binding protein EcfA2